MSDNNQVEAAGEHKVFVGNVPFKCTSEEFAECFKALDGYRTADVVRFSHNNASRGFGFVSFETKEQADALLGENENIELLGRKLRISPYEYEQKALVYHVFVRDVPTDWSDDQVKNALEEFGEVTSVVLNRNREDQQLTGSGVVGFANKESMLQALTAREKVVSDDVTLSVYPFRRHLRVSRQGPRSKALRDAYEAGYKAGQKNV